MEGLISFGVGALACLVIGVCAVLAGITSKTQVPEDGGVPPFKERMKWFGFFLLYIITFIVSVPVGIVIIIRRSLNKNNNLAESESVEKTETEEQKGEE